MPEHDNDTDAIETIGRRERRDEFLRMVGALGFSERLADALSAQNLHALDHIKRNKLYIEGGYKTFDDFLDHDPHASMKADTFRRRWNLLKDEGDETFNLLNSLKVPLETRKLLAGEIEVKDNVVTIGGIGTQLDDTARVIELIALLHKKSVEQQRTIERKDKKLEQGQKDFDELKRRAVIANPDGTETGQAVLTLAGAFRQLEDKLKAAPDAEKLALRETIFDLLSNKQIALSVALGIINESDVSEFQEGLDEAIEDAAIGGD